MPIIRKLLISSLVFIMLLGCSHTGGIIGNLVPAPKILKGHVDGDTYYSPEDAFSVQLPHPPSASSEDSYEWTYSEVREIKDRPVIGVIFGPAAFDFNYYHAVLIREPMQGNKEEYVKKVFDNEAKGRGKIYIQKHYEKFNLDGRDCYYAVYDVENGFLVLSLIDNKTSFSDVEADVSNKSAFGKPTLQQLTERKWDLFNRFLESFKVHNDKYKI